MTSTPLKKRQLRWLLRVLCDPPFLRLYVDAVERASPPTIPLVELEHIFFHALPADDEHHHESRSGAWYHLRSLADANAHLTAPLLFHRLHRCISEHLRVVADDKQRRLAAFYGLDFLFPSPDLRSSPLIGYVETHAHFRGSVPQDTHWKRLMEDARLRAAHRTDKDAIQVGSWKRTRAELLELAHHITQKLASCVSPGCAPTTALDAALSQLGATDPPCPSSAALLALRANFGRHLTSQRGKDGLTTFTNQYGRFSDASKRRSGAHARLRDDVTQLIATLDGFADRGVSAVELRPTVERTRIELQNKLRPLILGYICHIQKTKADARTPVRLGLVLSLFKQELSRDHSKPHPDGSTRATWIDDQRDLWRRQFEGLLDVLDNNPALRLFVVGVDAAGREQGCPVRDFKPAFELIHDFNRRHGVRDHTPGRRLQPWLSRLADELPRERDLDRQLANADAVWDRLCNSEGRSILPVRLGITVHAGEDFCDPITGLREIWEAIDHLGLRCGDRLGHALAASLNPKLLSELLRHRANTSNPFVERIPGPSSHYRLTKPLGVHLLDEAWENGLSSQARPGDLLLAAARTFAIPSEACPMSEHLRRAVPPAARIPGLHFYEFEKTPPDLHTQVTIDDAYHQRFERLRTRVIDRIRRTGIFIESCPTSNIVVAGLETPPLRTFLDECPQSVTVASDDPAIFNAWPDHELRLYGGDSGDTRARLIANSARAAFI